MSHFIAHISVPAEYSERVGEHLGHYSEQLAPLYDLSVRPLVATGPSKHPLTYFEVSGGIQQGPSALDFDSDDGAAVFIARMLSGHLGLIAKAAKVHHVSLGEGQCRPPLDSTEGAGGSRLALIGLLDSTQPGLDGVEVLGLGCEDNDNPRLPLYPLVTEWPHDEETPVMTFLEHAGLEDWARDTFEDWLIVRL